MGYQNQEIWEQPHGWQIHARAASTLRSKTGIRNPISECEDLNYSKDVPCFNWFEVDDSSNNTINNPDKTTKLLDGVKLTGWHPHHYRLDHTRYHNLINAGGDNVRAGDLFPNYQEALLSQKMEELPEELKPEFGFI